MKSAALLFALLVVLASLATPAVAGTAGARFALRVETGDSSVDAVVGGSLRDAADHAWAGVTGDDWDVALFGPYDVVRAGATITTAAPLPGEIDVTITLNLDVPVPSESAAARELARRLEGALYADLGARLERRRARLTAPAEEATTRAAGRVARNRAELALHRETWGDAATEYDLVTARLRTASEDLARARIDRAVAAARLETARSAVEMAAEYEDLRRQVAALEASGKTVPESLRTTLAATARRAAPLDDARRTAFDLEVELVGLEARVAALEPEIKALRARLGETARARAEADTLTADAAAARADLAAAERTLQAARDAAARVQIVVVQQPQTIEPR